MVKKILVMKQTNILSAAVLMMATVLFSRALGLGRDWFLVFSLSHHYFTKAELDLFWAAFRIPDMIFQLLVMGALATAFIPVITGYFSQKKDEEAWYVSSVILNLGIGLFLIFCLAGWVYARDLSRLIAPGFAAFEWKIEKMAEMTKIMLLGQLFFVLSNYLTGVLQSLKRFFVPALAPVFYNLGIIFGIIFLSPSLGIFGPVWGVVIGTFLHFFIQLPLALKLGLKYRPVVDITHPGVREIGKLMLPRTIGLAVGQIDLTVDVVLASFLRETSLTALNFAQHLQQLPIGLFGMTIAQAALPTLAEEYSKNDTEKFKSTLLTSINQILFLVLPSSVILIILKWPLVRLIFGVRTSAFDWPLTDLTARTLMFFSLGLFAQSVVHLLARGFYAARNTKTPLYVSFVSIFIGVFLSIVFIRYLHFDVWGLALSTSISNITHAVLLFILLSAKVGGFKKEQFLFPLLKMLLASFLMGVALYIPVKLLDNLVFNTQKTLELLSLTLIAAGSGVSIYIFLAWLLDISEAAMFLQLLKKLGNFKTIFSSAPEVLGQEI